MHRRRRRRHDHRNGGTQVFILHPGESIRFFCNGRRIVVRSRRRRFF